VSVSGESPPRHQEGGLAALPESRGTGFAAAATGFLSLSSSAAANAGLSFGAAPGASATTGSDDGFVDGRVVAGKVSDEAAMASIAAAGSGTELSIARMAARVGSMFPFPRVR
jgi:hypothetical protein